MILLQAQHVARHFGAEVLFEDITMEIQDNARLALVGRNGAGKSTLLKIIAGVEAPDEGQVSKTKELSIGYLEQQTGLQSEKTIWEEMLDVFTDVIQMEKDMRDIEEQLSSPDVLNDAALYEKTLNRYDTLQHDFKDANGYGYQNEIRSVLHGFRFFEEDYDRPIEQLSGGQKTRLALARLLLEKKDLLILDEPTNHLDIETLSWLETYLQTYPGALLIVSHDRYFLDKVVNEVYEISRQHIIRFKGNYSDYLKQKAAMIEQEWKQYEKQQKEIEKLEDFVNRNLVRASTTKRAQSRRKQLDKMDKMDKPKGDEKSASFQFRTDRESGNVVLQTEDLSVGYDAQTPVSSGIDLDIRKGDAVAVVGPNGIGKSTLLKTIMGDLESVEGEVRIGTKVDLGYYDQEQGHLHPRKTVLAELWDEHPTTPEKDIRTLLGSFLFSGDDVEKTIASLSGGEKARVSLAKLALERNNSLILDEPTNHLDIDSKEVLENALIDFDGTILFVSHDRYFINRIANKVIDLSKDSATLYLGDYDYFVQKKAELEELERIRLEKEKPAETNPAAEKTDASALSREAMKELQRRRRQLERRIEEIEAELSVIEQETAVLQLQLSEPEVYEDYEKAAEFTEKIDSLQEQQLLLMEEWEDKSLELEGLD